MNLVSDMIRPKVWKAWIRFGCQRQMPCRERVVQAECRRGCAFICSPLTTLIITWGISRYLVSVVRQCFRFLGGVHMPDMVPSVYVDFISSWECDCCHVLSAWTPESSLQFRNEGYDQTFFLMFFFMTIWRKTSFSSDRTCRRFWHWLQKKKKNDWLNSLS